MKPRLRHDLSLSQNEKIKKFKNFQKVGHTKNTLSHHLGGNGRNVADGFLL